MSAPRQMAWGHAVQLDPLATPVAVVGVGESALSKASGRTTKQIAAEAAAVAIADAGLEPHDIDGIQCSPGIGDQLRAADFHEHFGTDHDMWESATGGGMRWAATAPHDAARAIADGKARHVLNTFAVAWATQRGEMVGGPGQSHAEESSKQNLEVPFGWFPQPVYFATIARRHMIDYGTRPDHLGHVAVTLRDHANRTPTAVMHDRPLSLEQYLASPLIADPFRKEDCCLISDGGGAYVVTSAERARDLAHSPVGVAGIGLGRSATGTHWAQQGDLTSTPFVFAGPAALHAAGLQPSDLDVLACYDPFTIHSIMYAEDLGFCEKGDGGPFVAAGGYSVDGGTIPYNTHGGLLSHAYVLGIAHVIEIVRQLRGEAANQVPGARLGAYGGYTGPEAALLVLQRGA